MKAIIPAAGLGTRFLPGTKSVPKELLLVLNKPVMHYVVQEALAAPDCSGVVVVKSPAKEQLVEYFERNHELEETLVSRSKQALAAEIEEAGNMPVSFVDQEEALGLGHAVHCATGEIDEEPFYVLLGDVIVPEQRILSKLHEVSKRYGNASVLAVVKVAPEEVSRFGIIGGTEVEPGVIEIDQMVEKPSLEEAPSQLSIFGRYLLSPALMKILEHTPRGAGNEIQLTDALVELLQSEKLYAVEIDPHEGYDTGTVPNWIAANVAMALKHPKYAADLERTLAEYGVSELSGSSQQSPSDQLSKSEKSA